MSLQRAAFFYIFVGPPTPTPHDFRIYENQLIEQCSMTWRATFQQPIWASLLHSSYSKLCNYYLKSDIKCQSVVMNVVLYNYGHTEQRLYSAFRRVWLSLLSWHINICWCCPAGLEIKILTINCLKEPLMYPPCFQSSFLPLMIAYTMPKKHIISLGSKSPQKI